MKIKHILLTSEDRKILERVRAKHREYVGHSAVVETQDVADAKAMRDLMMPAGWTEATPGGMATNPDPVNGGIVDTAIVTGEWFAIANREVAEPLEGFATRAEAFAALRSALAKA